MSEATKLERVAVAAVNVGDRLLVEGEVRVVTDIRVTDGDGWRNLSLKLLSEDGNDLYYIGAEWRREVDTVERLA